jgi:hypothetical protein
MVFTRKILPSLQRLPIRQLADATSLSPHYCSLIRLGKRVPHPRHWASVKELTKETPGSTASVLHPGASSSSS